MKLWSSKATITISIAHHDDIECYGISFAVRLFIFSNGPPHFSNEAYAYAKRMIDVQVSQVSVYAQWNYDEMYLFMYCPFYMHDLCS